MDPRRWLDEAPSFQTVLGGRDGNARIDVLRDDLLEAGTKLRFLPLMLGAAREVVYGGPFCGAAALALAVWAREAGRQATLFYAGRQALHPRQQAAQRAGARLVFVRPGYMTVVQKRARDYAALAGARFLPLGFDVPEAIAPLAEFAGAVRRKVGAPDQVWCAAGSGMLARILARAFPSSEVWAVAVGLASRHNAQAFPANLRIVPSGMPFEKPLRAPAPFPSCPNYDLKAWAACMRQARGRVLFWNVAGPV